jgi:hypothetical protein
MYLCIEEFKFGFKIGCASLHAIYLVDPCYVLLYRNENSHVLSHVILILKVLTKVDIFSHTLLTIQVVIKSLMLKRYVSVFRSKKSSTMASFVVN